MNNIKGPSEDLSETVGRRHRSRALKMKPIRPKILSPLTRIEEEKTEEANAGDEDEIGGEGDIEMVDYADGAENNSQEANEEGSENPEEC
jgi:hypothetical protein